MFKDFTGYVHTVMWPDINDVPYPPYSRKYRSDYRTFYDAAFCASMAFHMMFYYMALNFPQSLETNGDVKKRNTFSCALIVSQAKMCG